MPATSHHNGLVLCCAGVSTLLPLVIDVVDQESVDQAAEEVQQW